MKHVLFIFLLIFSLSEFSEAQQSSVTTEVPDTIFKLGGQKILARILGVTSSKITYREFGQAQIKTIERKQVRQIVYKTGAKEVFSKSVFEVLDKDDYRTVILTDDPSEVQGLTKKGEVSSKSSNGSRTKKSAKRSAEIRLQKKAAILGAQIVLVTKKEPIGGYGEIPTYYMEGIAYGVDFY